MSSGGLSPERLDRLRDVLSGYVERGDIPGVVALVNRRDETHVVTLGKQAIDSAEPMRRDTLFHVASMTKPVFAVAAMILVEETRLRLDDPVDHFLPELADRKVLRTIESEINDTVPAERAITLRDLLTLRPGIGAIMAAPGTYPIQQAFIDTGLQPGPDTPDYLPDEYMARLSKLPLVYQPGERWMYHTGFEILGVLLARAAKQPLQDFLFERIFAPLGMMDTGFHVPPSQGDRIASCYHWDDETKQLAVTPANPVGSRSDPVPAACELISTADDYLAFGQMMRGYGKYGSKRLLARPTVELMIADQITPEQKTTSHFVPGFWENTGWGFGVSVITKRSTISAVPGRFGWDGGYGTSWYCDPKEQLTGIMMIQRSFDETVFKIYDDFWTLVYQSIDD